MDKNIPQTSSPVTVAFGADSPRIYAGDTILLQQGSSSPLPAIQVVDFSLCDNKRTDFDTFVPFKGFLNIPFEYQENLTFTTSGHVKIVSEVTNTVNNSPKTITIPIQVRQDQYFLSSSESFETFNFNLLNRCLNRREFRPFLQPSE